MGCCPLGKMMSRTLRKCSGKGGRRLKGARVHSPPPGYYSRGRQAAKNVAFSDDPVVVFPAVQDQSPTSTKHRPIHHPAADVSPSAHAEIAQNKEPDPVRVRFSDGPEPHPNPDPHRRANQDRVRFTDGPEPYPDPDPHRRANLPCSSRPQPGPVYAGLSSYRYVPSPLARWEEGGERRRPEYFSGEYRYYPTPVREGIYSIATDANRLTTIFSEENPNACSIV
ncbi:uncharacterized protein LOC103701929 [Phoenix dactylifera]|uniref:Uncharacterized protein LOC103701929 n=1 Tax=Phoenix dactylifera TaxID=42345 RepID=A0A8B7BNX3_PHODC|nr:uncharacterized protein LOC103701929 [Phoenix dactylifera]